MKIVLADDHSIVRQGFEMILNAQQDMEVVAAAQNGQEAYWLVGEHKPDILLLDISMPPGESGLSTVAKLQGEYPETKIIVLSMYSDQEYLTYVMDHGALGYVLKTAPEKELLEALRTVYGGGMYISKEMLPLLVNKMRNRLGGQEDHFSKLTDREIEVLTLMAKGYGNKEIAELLFLAVKTVESTKTRIYNKLQINTRPELVEYAVQRGLLKF